MGGFCSVVDATYVVYMTKNKVDYNLWGVYQQSGRVSGGGSVSNWATQSIFFELFYLSVQATFLEPI